MKYLVLTREITNGGDYLIQKKVKQLLEKGNTKSTFIYDSGFNNYDNQINYLNKFDSILICGGPIFENRLLNKTSFPLFRNLERLKVPVNFIGAGWYGRSDSEEDVYHYRFKDDTREILNYVHKRNGFLGCRDFTTQRVLNNNGFYNTIMTGCPVWYDFDYMNQLKVKIHRMEEVKKIAISDPGLTKNEEEHEIRANQAIDVIKLVQELFPKAQIVFTFNNGVKTKYSSSCNELILNYLLGSKLDFVELTHDAEKFNIYDECDLHIGYRVHSHIYSLSRRIPSILISEDGRGLGLSSTLGLEKIYASDNKKLTEMNPYLLEILKDNIHEMFYTDFIKIENAFLIMKRTYENNLVKLLKQIGMEC